MLSHRYQQFSWNSLIVFLGSAILCSYVPASAFGQKGGAPKNISSERKLPSRYPFVVKDALKYCDPSPGFWIDLGAGKGQVAIPLIEATRNPVMMIDPDREAMAKGLQSACEKEFPSKLTAVVGVAESLPLLDDSVDFLISRGSIFFWDDPVKGLREVRRVLRPGSAAYIGGGAGSGYPAWATEKLIASRKAKMDGEEAEKWQEFIELRRPEQMKEWAEKAGLAHYRIMGQGAISAEDERVGQGVWIIIRK